MSDLIYLIRGQTFDYDVQKTWLVGWSRSLVEINEKISALRSRAVQAGLLEKIPGLFVAPENVTGQGLDMIMDHVRDMDSQAEFRGNLSYEIDEVWRLK